MTVNLKAERLNRGYSIRGLARQLEISAPTLQRAEDGEQIHPATAKAIADFYGYKVTDIWPLDTEPVGTSGKAGA